ncbi:MAG: hypothetical protein E7036_02810 [Opitutales bacterium]|nr:hypothetical protein [Opitutales bacterium]
MGRCKRCNSQLSFARSVGYRLWKMLFALERTYDIWRTQTHQLCTLPCKRIFPRTR